MQHDAESKANDEGSCTAPRGKQIPRDNTLQAEYSSSTTIYTNSITTPDYTHFALTQLNFCRILTLRIWRHTESVICTRFQTLTVATMLSIGAYTMDEDNVCDFVPWARLYFAKLAFHCVYPAHHRLTCVRTSCRTLSNRVSGGKCVLLDDACTIVRSQVQFLYSGHKLLNH